MPTYEYMTAMYVVSRTLDPLERGTGVEIYVLVDGNEVPLNKLGKEGWSLVANTNLYMVFMREVDNDSRS